MPKDLTGRPNPRTWVQWHLLTHSPCPYPCRILLCRRSLHQFRARVTLSTIICGETRGAPKLLKKEGEFSNSKKRTEIQLEYFSRVKNKTKYNFKTNITGKQSLKNNKNKKRKRNRETRLLWYFTPLGQYCLRTFVCTLILKNKGSQVDRVSGTGGSVKDNHS